MRASKILWIGVLSLTPFVGHAELVRSAAGDLATVAATRDQFRVDLGGGTIAGANGSFSDGTGARREVNWDGVPDSFAAPNLLPSNFFNANSPRGVVFSTPGTGVQVSADSTSPTGTPIEFGHIDPTYSGTFAAFSPERLFTAIGSNIVDVSFFLPGTSIPALTAGFGAIFTDVDLANTTSLEFFDVSDASLGIFFVPNVPGANESLSFLGVSFDEAVISRVRITAGNTALGPGILDGINSVDVVVMDDFLYAEPVVAAVPLPGTAWLVIFAFPILFRLSKRNDGQWSKA